MSTDIETNLPRHQLRTFWGGDSRGVCIQVTCNEPVISDPDQEGYIQLTMEEASELIGHLATFVKEEAVRRQELFREQLKQLVAVERTVFHEVANLSPEMFNVPSCAVEFVSKFCPKSKNLQ